MSIMHECFILYNETIAGFMTHQILLNNNMSLQMEISKISVIFIEAKKDGYNVW